MTSLSQEMFEQTCRTCLTTNGEMVPIFSSCFYVNHLPKKLMAFTKFEISNDDSLPKVICKKCMFMADSFYCFKEQCESADNQLKLLMRKNWEVSGENYSVNEKTQLTDAEIDNNQSRLLTTTVLEKTVKDNDEDNDYMVEYISEEVRIDVENAFKRRQEAERRIGMEKLSETIKNLKGIEVVPINKVEGDRNVRKSEAEKDEIVAVSGPESQNVKRCNNVEVINDSAPPLNKRLKLPPETTVSRIDGNDLRHKDFIVYGKHKKLNFSTVRKIVKIDDHDVRVETKELSNKENYSSVKNDEDDSVIVVSEDNDTQDLETNSEKKDLELLENKILLMDPKNKNVRLKTLIQLSKEISVDIQDSVTHNENDKQDNVNSDESNEDVKILANQELKNLENLGVVTDTEMREPNTKSAIGSMILGMEAKYIDDTDKTQDLSALENNRDRKYNSNGVFLENEVRNISDKATESLYHRTKNYFKSRGTVRVKKKKNSKFILKDSDDGLEPDPTTSFALSRISSLREENQTTNSKFHETTDAEEKAENIFPLNTGIRYLSNSSKNFYQCTICSINFSSMPAVLKHNIRKHMLNKIHYVCLICDKIHEDKKSLCDHVEEHNGARPYKCTFCTKEFTLKRNLKRHVNHHINYKPYQCSICTKRFSQKSSLKSHTFLHTGNSPFSCKSCNVSFNNKPNWRRHVMTVHEKIPTVSCKFCNKELPNIRSLQVHTRIHTGDRPYQCPYCNKKFTQQCNLNTHIHCHLNDRPFVCPHCGKGFNQRGTRDDHILTHTGVRRHKCTECDASFTVASALKRHLWTHTDKDKPYNCKNCKLQFVGLYDLRRHLKRRHGEIVRLFNPRVERVVIADNENKEDDRSNNFASDDAVGSIEFVQKEIVQSFDTVEVTTKENNSLTCNVNKIEDLETEKIETKSENF